MTLAPAADALKGATTMGNMVGALMPDDSKAVLFAREDMEIEQAQLALDAPGVVSVLVADVRPGFRFIISDNGQSLGRVGASAEGTLYFGTSEAPSHNITVTMGESNIPSPPTGLRFLP